jgi:hypothetical protein
MGGGNFSFNVHQDRVQFRATTGASGFVHDDAIRKGVKRPEVHPDLNPLNTVRESRDSLDHPESNAVAVIFDETGSMRSIPEVLQDKLGPLMSLLVRGGYLSDPQILFGAVGDAGVYENVPHRREVAALQIGQFESDNRMEDCLSKIYLEGMGGGNRRESYELVAYYFARHTSIDCYEKRGRKGYLFIVGDEMPYEQVNMDRVQRLIGGEVGGENITAEAIFAEVRRKYHVFVLIPEGAQYTGDKEILNRWKALVGDENVVPLDKPEGVAEAIAGIIGMNEGVVDLDGMVNDLASHGTDRNLLRSLSTALAPLSNSTAVSASGFTASNLPAMTGSNSGSTGIEML